MVQKMMTLNDFTVTSRDPAIVAQVRIRCSSDPWAAEQIATSRKHFFAAMQIVMCPNDWQRRDIAKQFFEQAYPEQHGRAHLCAEYALHHARTIMLRGECWYVDYRHVVRFARLDFPDMHSTPFRPLFILTV
jgi:hypothetical protein